MEPCQRKLLLFLLPAMTIIFTCPSETWAGCCCPTFWTAYNRHCYRLFSPPATWQEAESFCNGFTVPSLGYGDAERDSLGHLVSIHSLAEHNFIVNLFNSTRIKSGARNLWLGLHDITNEGSFEWTDGSPFNFTMWAQSPHNSWRQPDNNRGLEDCGAISVGYGFKWNDQLCTASSLYFVCKLPLW